MKGGYQDLLREVERAGSCSHPIRLRGEKVNLATGEVGNTSIRVACKDRRSQICPACSYLYKADAWILVSAGLVGRKGIPDSVVGHPRIFATLTAPSFGPVHVRRADASCHERATGVCQHGVLRGCSHHHEVGDPRLGTPVCPACFDYEGAVLWNAHASRLWNRTIEQVRLNLATKGGLSLSDFRETARLNYLKVAEFQRRGLVHFHVVLRVDGGGEEVSLPPSWLGAGLLDATLNDVIQSFELVGLDGVSRRWGGQIDIKDVAMGARDDLRIASYIAKYATKSTSDSIALARRLKSRLEIRQLQVDPHLRRLALTAWDLAETPDFEALHLRNHAHAFGFTGQLITKSRLYSTTFSQLRGSRSDHMARGDDSEMIAGTFVYEGRGYDDPRAGEVAELLHQARIEVRKTVRQRRVMSHGISEGATR